MKKLAERVLVKLCRWLGIDLLPHAHVQIGAGHNTYLSGEADFVNKRLRDLLPANPGILFDVGANVGTYAKMLRSAFPHAAIHCFEPLPANVSVLEKNTAALDVTIHPFGLSASAEDLSLAIASGDDDGAMATLYREGLEQHFAFIGNVSAEVMCRFARLDDTCAGLGIDHIDFLKIDVEGHELQVLRGAGSMLQNGGIAVIQFEFNEFNIVSRSFMKDFYDVLPGYRFFRIMPSGELLAMGTYDSMHEIFRYQNIVAVYQKPGNA